MSTADQQLTPAEIRLAQYVQRTSTWSTATHNDGTEKALYEIALGLKGEVDRLRAELARRVQCNDCGAVGEIFTATDGLAYLDPSGQIGHQRTAARP
ncbi:hypothetical protein [Streptomyces achromogenes]|uniref:hypothetical protein n=1 Tax=Streptomyces achromogenes TaxID=67255 RepID=UPI0036F61ECD